MTLTQVSPTVRVCQSYHCLASIALLLRHPLCGNVDSVMSGLMYDLSPTRCIRQFVGFFCEASHRLLTITIVAKLFYF